MNNLLKRGIIFYAILLFILPNLLAQDIGTKVVYALYGGINDSFTRKSLVGAQVYLLKSDSSVVDSMTVRSNISFVDTYDPWFFYVPKETEPYIVHFTMEGYSDQYINIEPIKFGRSVVHFVKDIYMKRKPREKKLGEAVVKATRVKFYTKGDTVVYNADAFQLSEGSMLDALIKQLPGVELKDDGRILVNGKYVDNLLLNGEDFFKRDRSVMLDNLPSYMVSDVKVYDKLGRQSVLVGRDMGDKEFVMDVNLKKQYSIGWLANVQGALGTESRYVSRAFALRFTPHSRLSFFGNMNNLNETRKPGQDGEWSPERLRGGLTATKTVGADYMINDRLKRYELSGNAKLEHSNLDNYTSVSSEKILPEGNTWGRNENVQKSRNTRFGTRHELFFKSGRENIVFTPYFNYNKWNNVANFTSATFSEDPSLYVSNGLLDSIRHPQAGALLRRLAINRSINRSKIDGRSINGGLDVENFIRVFGTDLLNVQGHINYSSTEEDNFSHYLVDYFASPSSPSDYRNQWTKNNPNRNLNYSFSAAYCYWLPFNMYITPAYLFGQNTRKNENSLYRLDRLAGWGNGSDHPLGTLPSEAEHLIDALDTWNSYDLSQTDTWHKAIIETKWTTLNKEKDILDICMTLPLDFRHYRLDYKRATVDGVFKRNTIFFEPEFTLTKKWHKYQHSFEFKYKMSGSAPDMTNLIELENNRNPLAIYKGNAYLKNSQSHNASVNYQANSSRKQRFFSIYANYSTTKDALAWGYVYDRSTGIYTYTPDNVNGNYMLHGGVNYSMPLDKAKRLTLGTYTFAQLYKGVDLLSVNDVSIRSTTKTIWMTETIRLDYRINKVKVGAKVAGSWNQANSKREGFATINVGDFNYGVNGQLTLPFAMELNTDITMFSRQGYSDPSANTNDLVWNASLSKRVMKGRLTFKLDGFDILGQLSNITQSLNGQGRYETYRNVIPRYVMLHCIYRLNINPKKRPGE